MSEVATRFHYAAAEDVTAIERVQDCTPILDDATERRHSGLVGSGEMRHAARIPMVVIEQYCNEKHISFAEFMQNKEHIKRMLNDPALAGFRIWEGAV